MNAHSWPLADVRRLAARMQKRSSAPTIKQRVLRKNTMGASVPLSDLDRPMIGEAEAIADHVR